MRKRILTLLCAAVLLATGCSSASSGKTGSLQKSKGFVSESSAETAVSSASVEETASSSETEEVEEAASSSASESADASLYTFQLESLAFQVPQDFWGDPTEGGDTLTFFYHYENDDADMAMLQFQSEDGQGLTADEFKDMKDDITEGYLEGMQTSDSVSDTDASEVVDAEVGGLPGVSFTAKASYSNVPLDAEVYIVIDESSDKLLAVAYFKTSGISSETDDAFQNIIDTALPADQVIVSAPTPSEDSSSGSSDESASSGSSSAGTNNDKAAALKDAEEALQYSDYSYDSLIDFLEYDGFTHEAAVYAADSVDADWKEEALSSANDYLKYSSMSESGLKDQLEFEKYTDDEVSYAMDHVDADWNAEALEDLKKWKDYDSTMSDDEIRDMLEIDGFTSDEISYAFDHQ